jgi:membrane-associated protein
MPSMAGMSGMRYRTFLTWNAAGGLLWGGGCVFLGHAFASALNALSEYLTWLPIGVLAVVAAVYVAINLRRRRQEQGRTLAGGNDA